MDIGKVVVYEHIHELRVTLPNSEYFTGLIMGIRSASSEQCKAIMRKHTNEQTIQNRAKQKRVTAEVMEQNELEQTAACIAWWKFEKDDNGEQSNYNGNQSPTLTMPLAIEMLGTVNWLYAQVKEASTNVENFMPKAANGLASTYPNSSNMTPPGTSKAEPVANGTKPSGTPS